MPWARFDDNFPDHRKVVDLSDAAFRLLVAMICSCARNQTDGLVKRADAPRLMRGYKPKHLAELVAAGNVHEPGHDCPDVLCDQPNKGEVFVHGYLERNRSKEKIEAERAAAAKRKADFLAVRNAKKNGVRNGVPNASGNASPTQPNPTQPVGHWVGSGSSDLDVSPPSPSAGDDDEQERVVLPEALEIIRATRSELRSVPEKPRSESA